MSTKVMWIIVINLGESTEALCILVLFQFIYDIHLKSLNNANSKTWNIVIVMSIAEIVVKLSELWAKKKWQNAILLKGAENISLGTQMLVDNDQRRQKTLSLNNFWEY